MTPRAAAIRRETELEGYPLRMLQLTRAWTTITGDTERTALLAKAAECSAQRDPWAKTQALGPVCAA